MLSKVKLHLLTHLQMDIRRFGPLVGCSTEIFESFNSIFRQCSILSNRQAPSRDIAIQFGKQEGFKHRVTGGWWKADNGDWVQVGPGIKRFVASNLEILENVGLSSKTPDKPGTSHAILIPQKFILIMRPDTSRDNQVGRPRKKARSASTTPQGVMGRNESFASNKLLLFPPHAKPITIPCSVSGCEVIRPLQGWLVGCRPFTAICASVACQSRTKLTYNEQNSGRSVYGRIAEIFAPSETSAEGAVAVLDLFSLKASRHPIFGMPVLSRSSDSDTYLVVPVEVSQCTT